MTTPTNPTNSRIQRVFREVPPHRWLGIGWLTASAFVCIPLSIVIDPFDTVMDISYILGIGGMVILVTPALVDRLVRRRRRSAPTASLDRRDR